MEKRRPLGRPAQKFSREDAVAAVGASSCDACWLLQTSELAGMDGRRKTAPLRAPSVRNPQKHGLLRIA
jgi:hypothetical protein